MTGLVSRKNKIFFLSRGVNGLVVRQRVEGGASLKDPVFEPPLRRLFFVHQQRINLNCRKL